MPLTPEHKASWLKALRSGKYPQAGGFLYNKTKCGFCCIGVDAVNRGWMIPSDHEHQMKKGEVFVWTNAQADELADKLFLNELNEREVRILMTMNDRGDTFEQIADYIEANL